MTSTPTDIDDDVFEEFEDDEDEFTDDTEEFEDEPGTDVATIDDDDTVEGEVVIGSVIKSPVISEMLSEIKDSEGPLKPARGMTKAKAIELNERIVEACENFGNKFDSWVQAGEEVVSLIETGLNEKSFAALKLDPIEWIKSVVTFPLIDPNARKLLSKMLYQLGLSVRGIAEITGGSKSQAGRDLADVSREGHVTKGKDGKEYTTPEPEEPDEDSEVEDEPAIDEPVNVLSAAKESAESIAEWVDVLEVLSRSDKFTKSAKTINKRYADRLSEAYDKLGEVIDKLTAAAEEL